MTAPREKYGYRYAAKTTPHDLAAVAVMLCVLHDHGVNRFTFNQIPAVRGAPRTNAGGTEVTVTLALMRGETTSVDVTMDELRALASLADRGRHCPALFRRVQLAIVELERQSSEANYAAATGMTPPTS